MRRFLVVASPARWLGVVVVAALVVAAIDLMERWFGFRSFIFAFNLHFILMAGAVLVDTLLAPQLASRRFVVSPAEVRIYRRLGVIGFMRALRAVGWHAMIRDRKIFDGTRRTMAAYERATRHSENSHEWLFVVSLAPTAWAIAHGWWDAAFWIGSMGVAFHVYPIMLQRTQRARLTAILARIGAGDRDILGKGA
jgi:hypothetical protein